MPSLYFGERSNFTFAWSQRENSHFANRSCALIEARVAVQWQADESRKNPGYPTQVLAGSIQRMGGGGWQRARRFYVRRD